MPPSPPPAFEPSTRQRHGSPGHELNSVIPLDAAPLLTLGLLSPTDPFPVGLSFCRWLSLAFDSVTLVTQPPSSQWMRSLHRQPGTSRFAWRDADSSADSGVEIVLSGPGDVADLRIGSNTAPKGDNPHASPETAGGWPSIAARLSNPSRVFVQTLAIDSWATLGPVAAKSALWACVLPPRVDAFIAYYQFIKAQREAGAETKFFAILDKPSDPEGYSRIEDTWIGLTARFLGSPIPLLGEIDGRLFSSGLTGTDESASDARWLRLCEENLGPPWPSDLQALLGSTRDELLDPAPAAAGEHTETRLYEKARAATGFA